MLGLFAIGSYVAFLGSFLYFAGFLSGFIPWHRPAGSTAAAVAIDLGLMAFFAITHSVMARPAFKRRWTRIVPCEAERSVYVLVASAQVALLSWQWRPLPGPTLWSASGWVAKALVGGQLLGFGIALVSTFLLDHLELFGLRQAFGRSVSPPVFRTPWLYRVVRHPLYLGQVIAFWSAPHMSLGRIVLALGLTLYVIVGARLEERDLVDTFGDEYWVYQREVPMIVPHYGALALKDSEGGRS
jgi:protein-S-isoprenylcysteine O-methyltransferase Ste14